jgi:predicted nucleic acid-binding protein
MSAAVFVDSSVFIYAHDNRDLAKHRRAMEWLERLWSERTGRTGIQVINECDWILTRKIAPALDADKAWDFVHSLLEWIPQPVDMEVVTRAREIEERFRLGWWDSLIVGAAQAQKCSILLTEDFQDRADYGGVTVRNPFLMGVAEAAALYPAFPTAVRPYRSRGRPRSAQSKPLS